MKEIGLECRNVKKFPRSLSLLAYIVRDNGCPPFIVYNPARYASVEVVIAI